MAVVILVMYASLAGDLGKITIEVTPAQTKAYFEVCPTGEDLAGIR